MTLAFTSIASRLNRIGLLGLLATLCFGQTWAILFQDDFNRPDSPVLGSPPWTEINENASSLVQGDQLAMPSGIEVDSGTLAFHYSAEPIENVFGCFEVPPTLCRNFGRPAAYAPLSQAAATVLPVVVSFDFTPHADARVQHRIGLMSAADGFANLGSGIFPALPTKGLEVLLQRTSTVYPNSEVSVVLHDGVTAGGVEVASKPWGFQFEPGQTYSVEMVIQADYSTSVRISDGTQTDTLAASAAALTFPLDQFYAIDAQGGVSFDGPAGEYFFRLDNVLVAQYTIPAEIDIKPGSEPNSINLSSAGVVPVAILSSANFDAATVDPDTVTLAGAAVKMVGKSGKLLAHSEDVNGDGLLDLVCQVLTEQFLIVPGDSIAVLEAQTFDGAPVHGEDSI